MSGYNQHAGMSNNAASAYSDGLKPLSKITAKDLENAGLKITKNFAVWLAKNKHRKGDRDEKNNSRGNISAHGR